ncbi:hypothetical protein SG34_014500 [Thalassomonas viridans]|uniref:Uncharacterized protein n=1 Tax=Thalassomonas viridans TaxID=137584 RepID=A0AAE9Z8A3_9GAMM|nr:hypothetical protein [Thalassomonas viridans]WDE07989.1 hypothetical protein SG34_014500 [Thalassomonas viridans]
MAKINDMSELCSVKVLLTTFSTRISATQSYNRGNFLHKKLQQTPFIYPLGYMNPTVSGGYCHV